MNENCFVSGSKCPYAYTSYPPPPPHSHHFSADGNPDGDGGHRNPVGPGGAPSGYMFSVLGQSAEEPTTYVRDDHNTANNGQNSNFEAPNSCCCCCCAGSGASSSSAFFGEVMQELRFITNRLRREDDLSDIIGEWKFAAIVIDRLCLIVFSSFAVISTADCLLSAPHLIA